MAFLVRCVLPSQGVAAVSPGSIDRRRPAGRLVVGVLGDLEVGVVERQVPLERVAAGGQPAVLGVPRVHPAVPGRGYRGQCCGSVTLSDQGMFAASQTQGIAHWARKLFVSLWWRNNLPVGWRLHRPAPSKQGGMPDQQGVLDEQLQKHFTSTLVIMFSEYSPRRNLPIMLSQCRAALLLDYRRKGFTPVPPLLLPHPSG